MIRSRAQRAIIYLLFFLSGSSGLVYEVIWNRKLTLIFGGTVYAVSTVLTVFFTGLALGAILIGRAMDRGRNPIRTYVGLELLLGTFGAASPLLFDAIDALYYQVHPYIDASLTALTAARFVLSFIVLLVPTTLMGATLPVLTKLVVSSDDEVAGDAGRLYAVNTFGAALGTLLASIVLIPVIGVDACLYLAGAMNISIGLIAWLLFRNLSLEEVASPPAIHYEHTPMQRYVLALFCVVGFLSMAYQVAWIRLLINVTGSTVYTFGLMLAVFIVGIGLGSMLTTRLLGHVRRTVVAFAAVEMGASVYSLFAVGYFDRLPILFQMLRGTEEGFANVLLLKTAINAIVLFVPTFLFGAAFPIVAKIYAERAARSGGDVGLVYSVNTIGGVLGSFVGGFVLLPLLGAQITIVSMSVAGLVVAALIGFVQGEPRWRYAIASACVVALVAGGALYRPWDRLLINSGPFMLKYRSVDALKASLAQRILYYEEGVNVNVAVTGDFEPRTIYINGKPMASTLLTDVANQYLLGHLPMLLHPDPKSGMVIGLGAGMTFGALARHDVPVDVIEISPEVVDGARLFSEYNRNVLDRPNATVIFDDGRNYLKTTRKKYDVITEDPLDPFFKGSGYLYDYEHFENARKALNPGGVMCQYLPLYQVGPEEVRIIMKTFSEVFPHVTAWFAFNDLLLIGSEEPIFVDVAKLRERLARPEIARDLREIGIDNEYDFFANYLFGKETIERITRDLPLNTDDFPIIEYLTPRSLAGYVEQDNVPYLLENREGRLPGMVDASTLSPAEFAEFTAKQKRFFEAREYLIRSHIKGFHGGRGIVQDLERAAEIVAPDTTASYYAADIYRRIGASMAQQGRYEVAIDFLKRADAIRADYPPILNELGRSLLAANRRSEAVGVLSHSLEVQDRQTEPLILIAQDQLERREFADARSTLQDCLAIDPHNPTCVEHMGRIE